MWRSASISRFSGDESWSELGLNFAATTAMAQILIVDDDKVMAEMLVQQLAIDHHEAVATHDVETALLLVAERSFDVVVSDIQMHGQDGFSLLAEVQDRRPDLPVVLISAFASDDVRQRAQAEGAFAFLAKPFTVDQLLEAVAEAL